MYFENEIDMDTNQIINYNERDKQKKHEPNVSK